LGSQTQSSFQCRRLSIDGRLNNQLLDDQLLDDQELNAQVLLDVQLGSINPHKFKLPGSIPEHHVPKAMF